MSVGLQILYRDFTIRKFTNRKTCRTQTVCPSMTFLVFFCWSWVPHHFCDKQGSKPFFLSYLLVVYTFGQMECLKSVLLLNGNLKIYWQCQIQNISIMYISCMLNTISCSLNSHWTWGNHTMLMPLLECSGRWHRFTVIRKECDRVVLFKSF